MLLLTLGRRLGVGMNRLISTGNEQVIDVAEFIACLERRGGGLGHALQNWRRFGSSRPVD